MQASRFGLRRGTRIALAAPVLLAMPLCFLLQHEAAALAAPLFGPWGAWPLGHSECTLGNQWPEASFALLACGVLAIAGRLLATNEVVRGLLSGLLVLWLFGWTAFALLSVLNTTC